MQQTFGERFKYAVTFLFIRGDISIYLHGLSYLCLMPRPKTDSWTTLQYLIIIHVLTAVLSISMTSLA